MSFGILSFGVDREMNARDMRAAIESEWNENRA
jgi:hypothetical protein